MVDDKGLICSLFRQTANLTIVSKMLGSEKIGLLKWLLKCRKHLDLLSTIPFTWDTKTQKFVLKSTRQLNFIKLKCYFATLYVSCYVVQSISVSSKLPLPRLLQCLFYLIFFGVGTFALFHQSVKSKDIVGLLNGMMLFESKQQTGK